MLLKEITVAFCSLYSDSGKHSVGRVKIGKTAQRYGQRAALTYIVKLSKEFGRRGRVLLAPKSPWQNPVGTTAWRVPKIDRLAILFYCPCRSREANLVDMVKIEDDDLSSMTAYLPKKKDIAQDNRCIPYLAHNWYSWTRHEKC